VGKKIGSLGSNREGIYELKKNKLQKGHFVLARKISALGVFNSLILMGGACMTKERLPKTQMGFWEGD